MAKYKSFHFYIHWIGNSLCENTVRNAKQMLSHSFHALCRALYAANYFAFFSVMFKCVFHTLTHTHTHWFFPDICNVIVLCDFSFWNVKRQRELRVLEYRSKRANTHILSVEWMRSYFYLFIYMGRIIFILFSFFLAGFGTLCSVLITVRDDK